MIRKYMIAVVQTNSGTDREANWKFIADSIDEAAARGAKLISFPEAVSRRRGGQDDNAPSPETREDSPTLRLFQQKAKEHGVYIHCGSFGIQTENPEDPRTYNTTFVVDPQGEVIAEYHKIHPFDVTLPSGAVAKESSRCKPGSEVVVVDTELGKLGLAICYDIRFPELFRKMTLMGAQLLFNPANFTMVTGKDHWEVLLRARALENGCYMVAAGQYGGPVVASFGDSLVVDPWGKVIARAGERTGIIYADIDLDYIDEVRRSIGQLHNRRPDTCDTLEA